MSKQLILILSVEYVVLALIALAEKNYNLSLYWIGAATLTMAVYNWS